MHAFTSTSSHPDNPHYPTTHTLHNYTDKSPRVLRRGRSQRFPSFWLHQKPPHPAPHPLPPPPPTMHTHRHRHTWPPTTTPRPGATSCWPMHCSSASVARLVRVCRIAAGTSSLSPSSLSCCRTLGLSFVGLCRCFPYPVFPSSIPSDASLPPSSLLPVLCVCEELRVSVIVRLCHSFPYPFFLSSTPSHTTSLSYSLPLIAWYKVKSRVSLVTSVISSIFLFVGFGLSWSYPAIAFSIGAIIAANLAINFALRVQATRKFFPPGLLLMLSIGVFVFLCILAARAPPTQGLPESKAGGGDTRARAMTSATGAGASRGRRGLLRRRPPMVPAPPVGVPRRPPAVRETP